MNGLLRRKARRAVILAGRAIAILALLIAAALGGVVLTLNTPAGRRLVIAETNRAIADTFRGTLEITSVRDVGLGGADDVDLVLRDAQGRVVASAEGVTVRTSVPAIVLAALRGKGDIPVVVSHAFVRRIGATLLRDSDGEPTLAHALEPRHRGHAGESSRGVRVDIRSLRVAELRASGQLASFEHLEARASGLVSSFQHDETRTEVALKGLDLDLSGILPERVTAHVTGVAHLPSAGRRNASASVEGKAGAIPVSLRAVMTGNRLDATARARAGGGTVEAVAAADLGEITAGELTVTVTGVDLHGLVSSAPKAEVHAGAKVRVRLGPGGAVTGDLTAHSEPIRVASSSFRSSKRRRASRARV